MCSYCYSKLRKKTAFIELHSRNEIAQLIPEFTFQISGEPVLTHPHFKIRGIDYYPCVSSNDIPVLLNSGYSYLIFDTGNIKEAVLTEFLRCDRKLILGSPALWKLRDYQDTIQTLSSYVNLGEGFYYYMQTGTSQRLPDYSKKARLPAVRIQTVPFIQNPFCIKKENFLFFEDFWAEH